MKSILIQLLFYFLLILISSSCQNEGVQLTERTYKTELEEKGIANTIYNNLENKVIDCDHPFYSLTNFKTGDNFTICEL